MSDVEDNEDEGMNLKRTRHEDDDEEKSIQKESDDDKQSKPKRQRTSIDDDSKDKCDDREKVKGGDEEEAKTLTTEEYIKTLPTIEGFHAQTKHVSKFTTILAGYCEAKKYGVSTLYFQFNKHGLSLYGKPESGSPAMKVSFLHKDLFQIYNVPASVKHWIPLPKLMYLKKTLSGKDVEYISFKEMIDVNATGLSVSASTSNSKTGSQRGLDVNLFACMATVEILKANWVLDCDVITSSEKFQEAIDFVDDTSETLRLELTKNKIIVQGITDIGTIGEQNHYDQKLDLHELKSFDVCFIKKYLKTVTTTRNLNNKLKISFSTAPMSGNPVRFSYVIEDTNPQSHDTTFIQSMTKND